MKMEHYFMVLLIIMVLLIAVIIGFVLIKNVIYKRLFIIVVVSMVMLIIVFVSFAPNTTPHPDIDYRCYSIMENMQSILDQLDGIDNKEYNIEELRNEYVRLTGRTFSKCPLDGIYYIEIRRIKCTKHGDIKQLCNKLEKKGYNTLHCEGE